MICLFQFQTIFLKIIFKKSMSSTVCDWSKQTNKQINVTMKTVPLLKAAVYKVHSVDLQTLSGQLRCQNYFPNTQVICIVHCVSPCIDSVMMGKTAGTIASFKLMAPNYTSSHCILHCHVPCTHKKEGKRNFYLRMLVTRQ